MPSPKELLAKNEKDIIFSEIIESFSFEIKGHGRHEILTQTQLIDKCIFDRFKPEEGMYLYVQLK